MMSSRSSTPTNGHKRRSASPGLSETVRRRHVARKRQKAMDARERANDGIKDEEESSDDDNEDGHGHESEEAGGEASVDNNDSEETDVSNSGGTERTDSPQGSSDGASEETGGEESGWETVETGERESDWETVEDEEGGKINSRDIGDSEEEEKSSDGHDDNEELMVQDSQEAEDDQDRDADEELSEYDTDTQEEQDSTNDKGKNKCSGARATRYVVVSEEEGDSSDNATVRGDQEEKGGVRSETPSLYKTGRLLRPQVEESLQGSVVSDSNSDLAEAVENRELSEKSNHEDSDEARSDASPENISVHDEDRNFPMRLNSEQCEDGDDNHKTETTKRANSVEAPVSDTESDQEQRSVSPAATSKQVVHDVRQAEAGNGKQVHARQGPITRKRSRAVARENEETPVARRTRPRTGNIPNSPRPTEQDDLVPSDRWKKGWWVPRRDNEEWLKEQRLKGLATARRNSKKPNERRSHGKT